MNPQVVLVQSVRAIIFIGCMTAVALAINMADTQKETGWCDIHGMECFERLAVRK